MNSQPIFICGAHKSGTSLMRSLFDGLGSVFTIPIESHFFQNMHYWVNNEYRRERPKKISKEQAIDRFCKFIKRNNRVEDRLSDSMTKGLFDEEKFREYIVKIKDVKTQKEILEIYYSAIYYSIYGKQLSNKYRIIEKSVENAEFAIDLSVMYPDAKFIHIVRNPYANFVSLRKFKSVKYGYPLLHRLVNTLSNNYYYLYKNQRIIENYYVVRYQDLVQEPEETIKDIAKYLEIPFTEKMLKPTSMGKDWAGNSTTGICYSTISDENLFVWKDEIYPVEVEYVKKLFPFILDDYNYEHIKADGSFWRPVKGESIQRYFVNRIYKFYLQEMKH